MLKFHTHLEYLSNYTTVTKEQKTTVHLILIFKDLGSVRLLGGWGREINDFIQQGCIV